MTTGNEKQVRELYKEIVTEHLYLDSRYGHLFTPDVRSAAEDTFVSLMSQDAIGTLMRKVYDYHPTTFIHSMDVYLLSLTVCPFFELTNPAFISGSLTHDVGKLFIPLSILDKKGNLSDEEFAKIETHTTLGFDLLEQHNLSEQSVYARDHHERINGTGYPNKCSAEQLSNEIRLLGILDVYSALSLPRAYKQRHDMETTISLLTNQPGKFDVQLLHAFIDLLTKKK